MTPVLFIPLIPQSAPLVRLLFLGNLFWESAVVERLVGTAQNELANIITILLMLGVGASLPAERVMDPRTLIVLALGLFAFGISTATGVLMETQPRTVQSDDRRCRRLSGPHVRSGGSSPRLGGGQEELSADARHGAPILRGSLDRPWPRVSSWASCEADFLSMHGTPV